VALWYLETGLRRPGFWSWGRRRGCPAMGVEVGRATILVRLPAAGARERGTPATTGSSTALCRQPVVVGVRQEVSSTKKLGQRTASGQDCLPTTTSDPFNADAPNTLWFTDLHSSAWDDRYSAKSCVPRGQRAASDSGRLGGAHARDVGPL